MKRQLLLASILVTVLAMPVFSQLAPPNPMGVAIGHMHLNVSDVNVQQKFWTDVGGKIVNREKIVMAQFPGIYVLIRKQDYNGGSVGSVINHFGFYVKDFEGSVARWKAAGLNWEAGANPGQGYLNGTAGVPIGNYENKTITTPPGSGSCTSRIRGEPRSRSRKVCVPRAERNLQRNSETDAGTGRELRELRQMGASRIL